jgi:hypothetical protein
MFNVYGKTAIIISILKFCSAMFYPKKIAQAVFGSMKATYEVGRITGTAKGENSDLVFTSYVFLSVAYIRTKWKHLESCGILYECASTKSCTYEGYRRYL